MTELTSNKSCSARGAKLNSDIPCVDIESILALTEEIENLETESCLSESHGTRRRVLCAKRRFPRQGIRSLVKLKQIATFGATALRSSEEFASKKYAKGDLPENQPLDGFLSSNQYFSTHNTKTTNSQPKPKSASTKKIPKGRSFTEAHVRSLFESACARYEPKNNEHFDLRLNPVVVLEDSKCRLTPALQTLQSASPISHPKSPNRRPIVHNIVKGGSQGITQLNESIETLVEERVPVHETPDAPEGANESGTNPRISSQPPKKKSKRSAKQCTIPSGASVKVTPSHISQERRSTANAEWDEFLSYFSVLSAEASKLQAIGYDNLDPHKAWLASLRLLVNRAPV